MLVSISSGRWELTEKLFCLAHDSLNPSSPFSQYCLRKEEKLEMSKRKFKGISGKWPLLILITSPYLAIWKIVPKCLFYIWKIHLWSQHLKIESSLTEQTLFTTPGLSSTTKHGPTSAILLGSSPYQRASLSLCSPIRAILLTSIALLPLRTESTLYLSDPAQWTQKT